MITAYCKNCNASFSREVKDTKVLCHLCSSKEEALALLDEEPGAYFSLTVNSSGISVRGSSKDIANVMKNVGVVSTSNGTYAGVSKPIDPVAFMKQYYASRSRPLAPLPPLPPLPPLRMSWEDPELSIDEEDLDMTTNLYAGISKERLKRIRADIEKDIRPDIEKRISAKTIRDYKNRENKVLHPEDVAVAKQYFREVEIQALAQNLVLTKRYKDYEKKLEGNENAWKYHAMSGLIAGVICGLASGVFGISIILMLVLMTIAIATINIRGVIKNHSLSKMYTVADLKKIKDDITDTACLAQLAKRSRTVEFLTVKNNADLHDLIDEVKNDFYRCNTSMVDQIELEEAKSQCEIRVAESEPDDFMGRLRNRQAIQELESEEETEFQPLKTLKI